MALKEANIVKHISMNCQNIDRNSKLGKYLYPVGDRNRAIRNASISVKILLPMEFKSENKLLCTRFCNCLKPASHKILRVRNVSPIPSFYLP